MNQRIEPMKIVLISNYAPERAHSMLKYAEMMQRGLTARGHAVEVVHPPVIFGRLPFLRGGAAKWIGYIDKYMMAPPWMRWKCRGADLVHVCDHTNSMYLRCAGKRPRVITCHDLISVRGARGHFAGVQVGRTGQILNKWIATSLARAKYVICVSQQTLADFRRVCSQSKAVCRVIHSSLNRSCFAASAEEVRETLAGMGLEANTPYVLHVGANTWYKNRLGAMRIFAELRKSAEFRDVRLILAGKPWSQEVRELSQRQDLQGITVEAPDLTDEALNALYTGARALLFPSLMEGYGWPILEAQACGCPVITTNRPPMTEVAGDAAILIEPEDIEGSARVILEKWPGIAGLREAGYRNLERFTEAVVMDAYEDAYAEVVRSWKG
jgi:glycosyltransferase involved in cell wall biosynthesis